MANWMGYVLLTKPAALTMAQWRTALAALARVLGRDDGSVNPSHRLHWRFSLDQRAVIVQASFDRADLDAADLTRLCRYISQALDGAYTPAQVRTALANHVTIFADGQDWEAGASAARAYLAANSAAWETEGA